ncbi:hypothetical protein ABFS82_04G145300 [Erythranthe guttata]|uniref:uncharacterized protein LOC105973466 n=1 Tax=Erythranthe guttata TaxID=4155 RepID=UPI00064DD4D4|nr:PREDICTED: uncharacterized protein LOC105973466 [Erythranthe guttata]|eukprot:XP_012853944.1 PREDICTED: uncharacterized protein LOC105973466 [Erythranthe guttata]
MDNSGIKILHKPSMESSSSEPREQLSDYDAHDSNTTTLDMLQPFPEIEDSFFFNLENQQPINEFKSTLDFLQQNVESLRAKASVIREGLINNARGKRKIYQQIYTCALFDDGHPWRKYGQYRVLNASYPRHHYSCKHKGSQGCRALKHVQRIEDDPPLFRTTYRGQHSCKDFLNSESSHQIIMDAAAAQEDDSSLVMVAAATKEDSFVIWKQSAVIRSDKTLIKQEANEDCNRVESSPLDSGNWDALSSIGTDHGDLIGSVRVRNWLVEVNIVETRFLELENEVKSRGLEENMGRIEALNERVEMLVEESGRFGKFRLDA